MSPGRTAALWVLAIASALLSAPAHGQNLPAGKGRETLHKACTLCHGLESIPTLRYTRKDWIDLVRSMKDMGAEVTEAEMNQIVDYLTLNFGKSEAAKKINPAPLRRLSWEKDRWKAGQALYRENCVVCHDADQETTRKLGPSFYHLFRREKMPLSSAKPSRSYIAARVRVGGPVMPSFAKKLTGAEIDTLIDYIASK